LGQDRQLYARVVRSFLDEAQRVPEQLLTCLRDRQVDAALKRLHSFKGLCGTVGAMGLAEQVTQLEHNLKLAADPQRSVDADTVHAALVAALTQPVATLRRIAQDLPQDAAEPAPSGTQASPTQVRELIALLQASNLKALDVYANLKVQADVTQAEAFSRIGVALDQLDFSAAAQAAQALLQEPSA